MSKVTPTQFGERLKNLREHKGFSIRQAALQSKS